MSEIEAKFHTLTPPPAKVRGVVGENAERDDRVDTTVEPVAYI